MTIRHKSHRWQALAVTAALAIGLSGCGADSPSPDAKEAPAEDVALSITDVEGRTVEFDETPEHIALGESRQAFSLLFLQPDDPVNKVAAWGSDLQKNVPDVYSRLLEIAPEAEDIPQLGNAKKGDLNAETLMSYDPDVFVMDINQYEAAESAGLTADLDKADLPYVVVDFRLDPVVNTPKSVEILGQLFDQTENAERFVTHYHDLVDPVLEAGDEVTDRVETFYWRSPGVSEPGRTYGDVNFGRQIQQAGGENLGTELISGDEGTVTTEQLIAVQPEAIIASGGQWESLDINEDSHTSYLALGYDVDAKTARESLAALQDETGYDELDAFDNERVYGVYHQFYDSPFNFIAYQAFAHWLGTPGFEDVDVHETWADFHEEFMPWPGEGNVTIALSDDSE